MNIFLVISVLTYIIIQATGQQSLPRPRWSSNSKYYSGPNRRGETGDGCSPGNCTRSWKCPPNANSTKPTGSCAQWRNGPWVCCVMRSEKDSGNTTPRVQESWGRNANPKSSISNGWEKTTTIGNKDRWNVTPQNSRTTKYKTTSNPKIVFPSWGRASWTQRTTKHPTSTTSEWWKATVKQWTQATAKPWTQATAKPWTQATAKPWTQATAKQWTQSTAKPWRQATPKVTRPSNTRKPVSSTKATSGVRPGNEASSSPSWGNQTPRSPTRRPNTQSWPRNRVPTTRSTARNKITTPLPNVNVYMCGIRETNPLPNRRGRRSNKDDVVRFDVRRRRNSDDKFLRVVGGEEAEPFTWPWMAALYKESSTGANRFLAAGSLINENFVLTCAHAFPRSDLKSSTYIVMLGTHNAQDGVADYKVTSVIQHPQYQQRYYYHDIALLRLEHPVIFNNYVMPVCLPSPKSPLLTDRDLQGKTVTVMGWGDDSFGGKSSRVLKEATLTVMSRRSCNASYVRVALTRIPRGITENMLCAGDPEGGKDACQGDSGGPLTSVERGRYTQVGIVAFGYQCGFKEYPGVYTKVAPYLGWIAENTERVKATTTETFKEYDYPDHDHDYDHHHEHHHDHHHDYDYRK